MRSREYAVEFAKIQLENESSVHENGAKVGGCQHYGKMEIQELLDYIYGYNSKGVKVETNIKVVIEQEAETQTAREAG